MKKYTIMVPEIWLVPHEVEADSPEDAMIRHWYKGLSESQPSARLYDDTLSPVDYDYVVRDRQGTETVFNRVPGMPPRARRARKQRFPSPR